MLDKNEIIRQHNEGLISDTHFEDMMFQFEHGDYSDPEDIVHCILCGKEFMLGVDGNELGFCVECQEKSDFPYDIDKYYEDYDKGLVVFKGFETMSRGILEPYRK